MTSLKMQVEQKQKSEAQAKARAAEPPKKAPASDPMSGEATKSSEPYRPERPLTGKSLKSVFQMGEERHQASQQRAKESESPDGAQDEPPPQKMLPDQQQPNTVPGNESPQAATAISPNMIWPGRHV
jgi:hypothetical protein